MLHGGERENKRLRGSGRCHRHGTACRRRAWWGCLVREEGGHRKSTMTAMSTAIISAHAQGVALSMCVLLKLYYVGNQGSCASDFKLQWRPCSVQARGSQCANNSDFSRG